MDRARVDRCTAHLTTLLNYDNRLIEFGCLDCSAPSRWTATDNNKIKFHANIPNGTLLVR